MEPQKTSEAVKLTDEYRIDLIRKLRNDLIKEFLDERNLLAYFAEQFNQKELNSRRVEFIKKELKELLIAPVDLVHYSPILLEMKHDGTASISSKNERLFYDELEKIFRKYIF
jgi:predicted class III extradiol MEMO1 family dioxygenase